MFALKGDLGAGKTTLIKGLCEILGVSEGTSSPSFSIVNEYRTEHGARLYHFDLYRLSGPYEVEDLGATELFASDALCAVEWADRAEDLLPPQRLDILFEHAGDDRRRVTITNRGALSQNGLEGIWT